MYDQYSLSISPNEIRLNKVKVVSRDEGYIENREQFVLDTINGELRKPDSLFIVPFKITI